MIDIHNHILVDIDDGPKTIEKSIALLKQAKDEGVTSIVATPHHLHPRYDNTFQQVLVKLAELRTHPEVQALDTWICEIEELSAFQKSTIEDIKGFISAIVDIYR
ncbi:CpsB/CapC family capsule biosynthesis tyrosine phosphatase, partial [Staphylococcus aureus]